MTSEVGDIYGLGYLWSGIFMVGHIYGYLCGGKKENTSSRGMRFYYLLILCSSSRQYAKLIASFSELEVLIGQLDGDN